MCNLKHMPILLIFILSFSLLASIQCDKGSSTSSGDPGDTVGDITTDTTDDTTVVPGAMYDSLIADHRAVGCFYDIPDSVIREVREDLNFYYIHTSHGSQIMTGIGMLESEDTLYSSPSIIEVSDDLGHNGDTTWATITRSYLTSHSEINVAFWSWCGGASDNTAGGINIYLNKVDELETEFPNVHFIYMTGHLEGTGVDGNLYAMNNLIRAYCYANNKTLFDFADIESYDPDGTYYPDEDDDCGWCVDWATTHSYPTCGDCAHSHCFNCYLKGKAFYWLCARIVGWDGS